MRRILWLVPILCGVLFAGTLSAPRAQPQQSTLADPATSAQARQKEMDEAVTAAIKAATTGPAQISLLDQARLGLPANMRYVPAAEAGRVLRALGNPDRPGLVGMVIGTGDANWIVVIRHVADGYVRDDEARDWKADDLLASIRAGTDEGNKQRAARGFPELEIVGWLERPAYQFDTHRMVWALQTRDKGAAASADSGVNYNTIALGRDGYISLNLVTEAQRLPTEKVVATTLLQNLQFQPGKGYADFVASTDRVAEYGLAALLGVVAAKKLGLLAMAGVLIVKFAKIGVFALAALGAGITRFFRRKAKAPAGGQAA